MKKLIFILLLISSNLFAQERFSKLYNSEENVQDLSSEILVLPDGYLFSTISRGGLLPDTFNYAKQFLFIVKTDFNGDTIWTKKYYKHAFGIGATKIVQMSDSTFLLAGRILDYVAYRDSNFSRDVFLIKINYNGDTLWTKTISLGHGDELVRKIIKSVDGGYLVFGQVCKQNVNDCDNFLIKLDSNANLIFTKKYSFNSTSFEQPGGIIELSDSSLYIYGNTQNAIDEENAYLIKLNKKGENIWQKRYGMDGNRRLGLSIHKIQNEILLNFIKTTTISGSAVPQIMRIDTSGNIVWQRIFGGNKSDVIHNLYIIADSIILAVGSTDSYDTSEYNAGWIIKITQMGDTIWQKIYNYKNIPSLFDRNSILYEIKPVNNGFIAIGYAYNKNLSTPSQDIWLLKIDSMGCLYENCITPTGIDEEEIKKELIIYPNPTNNNFKISYYKDIISYKLIDFTGRIIQQDNYSDQGVNIELLPSGIYMVQVVLDDDRVMSARLMVK